MNGFSPKWVDKAVTGAGTTAIIAADTTTADRFKTRWVTGIVADIVGLGTGEYATVGANDATTTILPKTYNNGTFTVDYSGIGGLMKARNSGPASTAFNVIRTGSSTKVNLSVGYYLTKDGA